MKRMKQKKKREKERKKKKKKKKKKLNVFNWVKTSSPSINLMLLLFAMNAPR